METYSFLRQFADSWMLLLMFLFFVGAVVWAFLPRHREAQKHCANIPFQYEDQPASEDDVVSSREPYEEARK